MPINWRIYLINDHLFGKGIGTNGKVIKKDKDLFPGSNQQFIYLPGDGDVSIILQKK